MRTISVLVLGMVLCLGAWAADSTIHGLPNGTAPLSGDVMIIDREAPPGTWHNYKLPLTFIANNNGVGTNTTFYGTSEFKGTGAGIVELYDPTGTILLGGFNGSYWWGNGGGLTNIVPDFGTNVLTVGGLSVNGTGSGTIILSNSLNTGTATITVSDSQTGNTNFIFPDSFLPQAVYPDIEVMQKSFTYLDDFFCGTFGSVGEGPFGFIKQASGTGATVGVTASDTTAPGTLTGDTGSTTTGYGGINASGNSFQFGGGTYTNEWRFKIATLPSGTNTFVLRFGFMDTTTGTDGVDGAFCRYDTNNAQLVFVCRSNNSESAATNATTINAATWYRARIVVNADATSATLTVNDANPSTLTSNIPTGTGRCTGLGFVITKTAGTDSRTADADYCYLGVGLTSSR